MVCAPRLRVPPHLEVLVSRGTLGALASPGLPSIVIRWLWNDKAIITVGATANRMTDNAVIFSKLDEKGWPHSSLEGCNILGPQQT